MKHKTNVEQKTNAQIIDGLSHLLADTYVLYLKTQNFHWNVTGPNFGQLHKMFEEQYESLAEAVDVLAERIRALQAHTPASFEKFLMLTSLNESNKPLSAEEMVRELMHDHEWMGKSIAQLFTVAEKCNDQVTLDMFIERKTEHDKLAWMLRSTLGNK